MKTLKINKFKLISLLLLVSVIALGAGRTIAYFTDAKESEGVFTAGNVYIEMTETAVKRDGTGNLIADTDKDRIKGTSLDSDTPAFHDYGTLFPGMSIAKDPTIKNVGDFSAWIAAKVIIKDGAGDINKLFGYHPGNPDIDIELLLSGGLLDERVHVDFWNGMADVCYNDRYAMVQVSNQADGIYEFYFFMLNKVEKGGEVVIFDQMNIHPLFGNEEMKEFTELSITVQAFAVQTFGFGDCYSAMREAFGEHFERCVP